MKIFFYSMALIVGLFCNTATTLSAEKYIYRNTRYSAQERAEDLLKRMSLEENIQQLQSQMVYTNFSGRDYSLGHVRNNAHFLHAKLKRRATPEECAELINQDTEKSIAASRWGIPVLQNGEALHGAQWGYATCFPQSISMAATFDTCLYYQVGNAVAKELRAVGVRQVFAPVINISRDPRWGRTEETYGEDVLLNSRMGLAYVKALENNGVIATPKHFVDNYGDAGHDSYASNTSWRTLREVFLEPFRTCIEEGKARSIMVSYNSVDGVPCTCNDVLINDILRKEWGFKGFVVSDYWGVKGLVNSHKIAKDRPEAQAMSLEAGMDVELPSGYSSLPELVSSGRIKESLIDSSVLRVLRCKFELGLFDEPLVNAKAADKVVKCREHQELSLDAARRSMTLLKNEKAVLPLCEDSVKRIGVFGPVADFASLGGYTGPYSGSRFIHYKTPYMALKERLQGKAEVVFYNMKEDIGTFLKECDVALFFAAINEGEGGDRSKLTLSSRPMRASQELKNSLIVKGAERASINIDQEKMIMDIASTGTKTVVILQNGAYIDVSGWIDHVDALLEAWYPGECGADAIVETLLGDNNPCGRLPFTWAGHSGQIPNYYSIKPSGRGYRYNDDNGKPLYPFGYGLSYTSFEYSDFIFPQTLAQGADLEVKVTVKNTGKVKGYAVPQLYLKDGVTSVVRPMIELKAFKSVALEPGESRTITLRVPYRSFGIWDRQLKYRVEARTATMCIGTDAEHMLHSSRLEIK